MSEQTAWYVLHTKPRRELLVASLLDRQDALALFLPEVKQRQRGELQLAPLFPCYLFVHADLTRLPTTLLTRTPGVIGLVGNEHQPLPVADEVVTHLRKRVAEVNAQGGLILHSFYEGERVRITGGSLQGLDAVFVGPLHPAARVQVLLHFLGRQQQVEVDVDLLEKAPALPSASQLPRPRRTRGQGRRIRQEVMSDAAVLT
ncbi:MAG: transcription termination/antitermination NusG family protein [Caldilineaceae bacterium]